MEADRTQYQPLQERILRDGRVLEGGMLRVDSFLNQQVDMALLRDAASVFAKRFAHEKPQCVMTIESSGIAPAGLTALALDVPLLICKKQASGMMREERLATMVRSFTKGVEYELSVSRAFLCEGMRVLFIDDFLAMGEAALGVSRLLEAAQATLIGVGIVIEKSFQPGRGKLEALAVPILSLARIAHMRAMLPHEQDARGAIQFVQE